jgi:hypothetical protein
LANKTPRGSPLPLLRLPCAQTKEDAVAAYCLLRPLGSNCVLLLHVVRPNRRGKNQRKRAEETHGTLQRHRESVVRVNLNVALAQQTVTALEGEKEVVIPMNTAPTTYTVQVLAMDDTGAFIQYGDSLLSECHIKIDTYDRLPMTLQGTMGFFCAFSLIFAASVWAYDVKKQNAIAAQWAQ